MSIRKLFDKKVPYSVVAATDMEELGSQVESDDNIKAKYIERKTFIPGVNYSNPANFAKFGSAEKYYLASLTRMYNQYPYDGSLKERTEFLNKSTYLDTYIFSERYPRTNGFIDISSDGAFWPPTPSGFFWPISTQAEYIEFLGGPHAAPAPYAEDPLSKQFPEANLYDTTEKRTSNLRLDNSTGTTIEFWFKHGPQYAPFHAGGPGGLSGEILFSAGSGSMAHLVVGTMRMAIDPTTLLFTMTTRDGAGNVVAGSWPPIAATDWEEWNHYAASMINSGSGTELKFYTNGELVATNVDVDQVEEVNFISGTIGAGVGFFSGAPIPKGAGKTSGSFDEFRYWKVKRSSQDIGRYWFTQVGGGTNTDTSNVDLGVYYKFNEGITGINSTDSKVLDYSGRITNGDWTGYPGSDARSIDSAMVLSRAAKFEFKDPIIYPFHPAVKTLQHKLTTTGSIYDLNNNAALYSSLPFWIIEEDEESAGNLSDLIQIMSSYFDTLYLQIQAVTKIKDMTYDRENVTPAPFSNKLLESAGLQAPEIFVNADIIAQILNRDEDLQFEEQLENIKNLIYKNIYNNLIYIYKSKGTMKISP